MVRNFSLKIKTTCTKSLRHWTLHTALKILEIKDIKINYLISGSKFIRRGNPEVALTLCLGQPADVYLIDEPSAYLDSEQRILRLKVIKR